MNIIEAYIIFAISGGITSTIVTFLPILNILRRVEIEKNITHTFVESPKLSMIVWAVMASVLIPLITLSILSKKENDKFIQNITKVKAKK